MALLGANTELFKSDLLREAELVMRSATERLAGTTGTLLPLGEVRGQTDEEIVQSVTAAIEIVDQMMHLVTRVSGADISAVDDMRVLFENAEDANSGLSATPRTHH